MIENAAGLDNASRRSASIDETRCIYFEKSMMTDVLQAWPAKLGPPPRGVMETSCALQSRTAATTSAAVLGSTMPYGICRQFEASVA